MPVKRRSGRGNPRKIDDLPAVLLKYRGNCDGVHKLFSKRKMKTGEIRRKKKHIKENGLYLS
jgi:hypothetical protein